MINRVVIVGRLTKDPELRKTNSGAAVASFTVAVDNLTKGPDGKKTTSFIPCTVWNTQAENMFRFTHKGSLVGVEGRLNQRTYDAKDGRKVSVVEVICDSVQFLDSKGTSTPKTNNVSEDNEVYEDTLVEEEDKNVSSMDVIDNDLPF